MESQFIRKYNFIAVDSIKELKFRSTALTCCLDRTCKTLQYYTECLLTCKSPKFFVFYLYEQRQCSSNKICSFQQMNIFWRLALLQKKNWQIPVFFFFLVSHLNLRTFLNVSAKYECICVQGNLKDSGKMQLLKQLCDWDHTRTCKWLESFCNIWLNKLNEHGRVMK